MSADHEQARRDLIADISHDLRTPLVAMRGYLELLVARGDALASEERQRYAEIALRQCEHLAHLVDELFELAKLDFREVVLEREGFGVGELASDVVQKFALAAREREITLEVLAAPDTAPAEADLRLTERVLENLVGNALRHTPRGGRVQVRVSPREGGVEVAVVDSGSGIAAEELPFVFERHFRGAAVRRDGADGAGLGLAIARRIVELHGGSIGVESETGRGCRFFFHLPAPR
ncbi:MAG: HAMP domain-containing histidine kinase [Burkholderiales bacterium]|nr:HAMP domain-containing histidine kinase [Burkholderiales bacterium]